MILQVKLFAVAKQIVDSDTFEIASDEPIAIGEIRNRLLATHPKFSEVLPSCRFAVNAAYVNDDTVVSASDEIAIIPPVSGG